MGLAGGSGNDTLDPHAGLTYLDSARAQSMYQSLVQLDVKAQNTFVLAESIEPNKTTAEWIIKLRPGITFHDGKPLTADDVIYTFRQIKTQGTAGANSLGPMDLANLKAVDKLTVKVPFTAPYGSFLDQLAFWYYLYIVPEGFNAKNPKQKPNGTGPFKFQSFKAGERSVVVKNTNFWQSGLPYLD